MKKQILCLAVLCMALCLPGCSGGGETLQTMQETDQESIETDQERTETDQESTETNENSKNREVLIAYFSWADNAEEYNLEEIGVDVLGHASVVAPGDVGLLAEYIQEATGADIFKITTAEKYSSSYNTCLDQAKEQIDHGVQPELSEHMENMEDYSVIFLGFPNWWYTIPPAVKSFAETHDLAGKTIIPFVSHGTGGLAGTIRDLTAILPEDCSVLEPYDIYEDDIPGARAEVEEWIDTLTY